MDYKGKTYLFCGVGGSGMSALAVAMLAKGAIVYGSDRSFDRGLFNDHFQNLINKGVRMIPQNGTGVTPDLTALVVSSAIESSIPDVAAAQAQGIAIVKRATLLSDLANAAHSICVGGTNGKSTVTGMIGHVLADNDMNPTILNGGGMLNFDRRNAVIGDMNRMVLETDESDGSITQFHAKIAVLTNISQDHKEMDELKSIFRQYLEQSDMQVLNLDCPIVASMAVDFPNAHTYTMSDIPDDMKLMVPGKHNISNGLAALTVAKICHVEARTATQSLNEFKGIVSRLEVVGETENGVTVIDDFGHNPDKIGASLRTLKETGRRLILMFQPHGFGPLKRQKDDLIDVFSQYLGENDVFYMPEAFYAGGTTDKSISSAEIVHKLQENGLDAHFFEQKTDVYPEIIKNIKPNDVICIMGARDDGLREMAHRIFKDIS